MGKRLKRMLIVVLTGLALGYVLIVAFAYFRQESMVYYPDRTITATPGDIGLQFEEVTLLTKDGINISAWYVPAVKERGVLLFCHGNAGNISDRLDSIRIFHALDLSVLIFDYRGYGKSAGSPSEEGTYLDAEAAWDYLVTVKDVRPEKIVLFGRSLGSAVAAELALRRQAAALIIESGFTSVPDLGKQLFPYLPVRLMSRFHYATGEKVRTIGIPKLFIHSSQDEIIPFEHGKKIFDNASTPKEFLQINGGHNEGFLLSGSHYINGLKSFAAKHL